MEAFHLHPPKMAELICSLPVPCSGISMQLIQLLFQICIKNGTSAFHPSAKSAHKPRSPAAAVCRPLETWSACRAPCSLTELHARRLWCCCVIPNPGRPSSCLKRRASAWLPIFYLPSCFESNVCQDPKHKNHRRLPSWRGRRVSQLSFPLT